MTFFPQKYSINIKILKHVQEVLSIVTFYLQKYSRNKKELEIFKKYSIEMYHFLWPFLKNSQEIYKKMWEKYSRIARGKVLLWPFFFKNIQEIQENLRNVLGIWKN